MWFIVNRLKNNVIPSVLLTTLFSCTVSSCLFFMLMWKCFSMAVWKIRIFTLRTNLGCFLFTNCTTASTMASATSEGLAPPWPDGQTRTKQWWWWWWWKDDSLLDSEYEFHFNTVPRKRAGQMKHTDWKTEINQLERRAPTVHLRVVCTVGKSTNVTEMSEHGGAAEMETTSQQWIHRTVSCSDHTEL